jgi:voltage-gated potassium channel Kch
MTTVGYGDYFPKTFPGRIVCFLAAFSGIILSSLMIVSVSAYLAMQAN